MSPTPDTEVSLLTLLGVTFDQAMDPLAYGLSFPGASGLDRSPQLLGQPEYDADQHRFTLIVSLPVNWNGELQLEGFKSKDGAPAAPMPLKYRTQRALVSDALRTRIEKAGRSARLCPLIEDVRKARREAEKRGWTVIEGLSTFAAPSGTTVRSVYEGFRDEILAGVKAALPLDAVLINVHGAMVADGYDDCEGDLLSKIRAIVGPKLNSLRGTNRPLTRGSLSRARSSMMGCIMTG